VNSLPQKVTSVAPLQGALDGRVKRAPRRLTDHRSSPVEVVVVDPLVLRAAKKAKRPGEKLLLIDERTVRLDHKGS